MWSWDQGRMAYFQYDALRAVSRFATNGDLKGSLPEVIRGEIGLDFPPEHYTPWRNYSRSFKLCLIVSEMNEVAVATDVARLLAETGTVTCDEYLHFVAQATTEPSPALSDWDNNGRIRHPLCFSLKYVLAKTAVTRSNSDIKINEIIGAYINSNFNGSEDQEAFAKITENHTIYEDIAKQYGSNSLRQARESIKFLCQISYLHSNRNGITVSLSSEDATAIFDALVPVQGPYCADGNEEIRRISSLFKGGTEHDFFDYQATTISNELDSGFTEGNKVRKSHVVIERNSRLRGKYFSQNPTAICDTCELDTHAKYPWTERILDIHHVLPLSSGTRVDSQKGTLLNDLIALCPTCHRAIHRYYEQYLRKEHKVDFLDSAEAVQIYQAAKNLIAPR